MGAVAKSAFHSSLQLFFRSRNDALVERVLYAGCQMVTTRFRESDEGVVLVKAPHLSLDDLIQHPTSSTAPLHLELPAAQHFPFCLKPAHLVSPERFPVQQLDQLVRLSGAQISTSSGYEVARGVSG